MGFCSNCAVIRSIGLPAGVSYWGLEAIAAFTAMMNGNIFLMDFTDFECLAFTQPEAGGSCQQIHRVVPPVTVPYCIDFFLVQHDAQGREAVIDRDS